MCRRKRYLNGTGAVEVNRYFPRSMPPGGLDGTPKGMRRNRESQVQESPGTGVSVAALTGGGQPGLAGQSITAVLRASPSRIFAGHPWNSRIRPRVYRPFEFVIPGTTDAADEMVRHIRHGQPLQ